MAIIESYAVRNVYSSDSSVVENIPKFVSIIETKGDIYKTIEFALSKNLSITLRGSGTNLCGNATSKDIVLDVSKYDKIKSVDTDNNVVVLQPGVIVDDLNIFLKKYDKTFPVIPSSHSVATIGGMISCNCAGHNSSYYGKMKEWVDSCNIIFYNKNRKIEEKKIDNTISGSEGALGVIEEVRLKIINIPKKSKKIALVSESRDDLFNFFFELIKNKDINNKVYSIEYINNICIENSKKIQDLISSKFFNNISLEKAEIFIIESIDSKDLEKFIGIINESLSEYSINMFDNKSSEDLWKIREEMFAILGSNNYKIIEDPKLRLDKKDFEVFLKIVDKNRIPTYGHILNGIFHLNFKKNQLNLISKMLDLVKDIGGNVSGEHGIGNTKKKYISTDEVDIYCNNFYKLKNEYDSFNVFNPEIFKLKVKK